MNKLTGQSFWAMTTIAVMITFFPAAPGKTNATNSFSDIPGIPINAGEPIIESIGGALVDQVYSHEIPGPMIVLFALNGESGSELGLYIFGAASTSVITDFPLATSAKPGGQQFISMRFTGATKIYVNVNGRNRDSQYQYTLSITHVEDSSPPKLTIASYPNRAQSDSYCLKVNAVDSLSGIGQIAVWESASELPRWQDYSRTGLTCQTFEPGDRLTQISIKVRNQLGLESQSVSLPVHIDDTPPKITQISPASQIIYTRTPVVKIMFDSKILNKSLNSASIIAYDQKGTLIPGDIQLDQTERTVVWTGFHNLKLGNQLVFMIQGIRDRAGNLVATPLPFVVTRKQVTDLSARFKLVEDGFRVRIYRSTNLFDQSVSVQNLTTRGWATIGTMRTQNSVPPEWLVGLGGTSIRVLFGGTATLAPSKVRLALPE